MREQIHEFLGFPIASLPAVKCRRGHHSRRPLFLVLLALWFLTKTSTSLAQIGFSSDPICRLPMLYSSLQVTNGRPEYEVKAAIIYRCLEFVQWPEEVSGSKLRRLRIGILGNNQFGPALELLKGKTVGGRKLSVTKVSGVAQASRCQLVFISSSETNRAAGILTELAGRPVLTVGETPNFTEQGGIINLLLVDKNIRFQVNAAAAEKAGIVLHPALVKLGTRAEEPSSVNSTAPAQTTPDLRGPG